MYDIHCHILPELDDGAQSVQQSLAMAAMAAKNGTTELICTPHCSSTDPNLPIRMETILARTAQMNALLEEAGIPLRLHPGMELLCIGGLRQLLAQGDFLTLANSRYLLLEFPFDCEAQELGLAAWDAQRLGLCPILAHPERYTCVQYTPELAGEWAEQGWLLQLNADSLLGNLGDAAAEASQWLVRAQLAHIVASDAHHVAYRTPALSAGYEWVARHTTQAYASLLFCENPSNILNDLPVDRPVSGSRQYWR